MLQWMPHIDPGAGKQVEKLPAGAISHRGHQRLFTVG
jgi:hypothetical protein